MRALALLALLPALALGQGFQPTAPSDVLRTSTLYTTAALSLYVDSTGSDANACTSTGTAACLTLQGALDKVPKNIRHPVVVTLAAGTFAGAKVEGFNISHAAATTGASLTIQGTLVTATLGAGNASGTATGGTRGGEVATPAVHSTLVDSGNAWTVNALRGYFIELTGGPGSGASSSIKAIESNTATTAVAAGRYSATPTTSTTYAIRDEGTIISGGATRNADLVLTTSAGLAGLIFQNNNFPPATLLIQKLKFASVGSYSLYMHTPTHVMVRYCNFAPGGTFAGILLLTGGSVDALANVWSAITSASYQCILQASRVTANAIGVSELSLSSNVFLGSGGNNGVMTTFTNGGLFTQYNYGLALARGLWIGNNASVLSSGDYFDTVGAGCISTSLAIYPGGSTVSVNGDHFASCASAIISYGRAFVAFTTVASTGSGNTLGLYAEDGGRIRTDATGYGFSATTDITVKTLGADVTSTAAAFRLLTPKVLVDANTQTSVTEL
jgi:hypothetical protein